jgi:ABC-2 type transport system ATP-binding protein
LAAVDLTHEAHVKVRTLSDGQLRRAGIAAGLAQESDVLLLDEPSVGLDAEQRRRVRNLITEIGRSRPVVISTHLLEDVSYMCERVGVLVQGRLVFDGTVAELETSGENQSADAPRCSVEAGYEQLLAVNAGIR